MERIITFCDYCNSDQSLPSSVNNGSSGDAIGVFDWIWCGDKIMRTEYQDKKGVI